MANNLKDDKPPILSQVEPLTQLQNMQGLSLILGRVSDSDTIQNSSKSINEFKNSMVYAKGLTWNDIIRVAAVQPGERKFTSSVDRPTAYREGGTSIASQQSGKAYTLDENNYLHVILGNSNLNWCENLYDSESFAKGLPTYKGNGLHTTSSGVVYATVGKMSDGVDKAGPNWFPITHWKDQWTELKELNFKDEKSQATRICGSSREQNTGTCCLYYKEDYYDDVAGVTWGAGDYYKCTCAKCYHCLEMARALNMDYRFNPFISTSVGPTGGTGERCQDCDLDNYPSNCGPCPCTIGTYDKFDVLLNDKFLPEKGLAKTNAKIAQNWNGELGGTVLCHVNLDGLNSTKREINTAYWGKEKLLVFNGPQEPGKNTKTVYRLATEVKDGEKEIITGLTLISTGTYTSMPLFPIADLKKMLPELDEKHFRMVRVPDFSKLSEISELVGGTRVQVNTTVSYSDIQEKTLIDNFNAYGLGVPYAGNRPLFDSKNNTPNSSILTYRHKNAVKTITMDWATDTEEQNSREKEKRNKQIVTTNVGPVIFANASATSISTVDLEMFAGNNADFTTDFEYVDGWGDTWTASNDGWLKPTSSQSNLEIDAQATDILHVNKFSLNIPAGTNKPGFINLQLKITLTL